MSAGAGSPAGSEAPRRRRRPRVTHERGIALLSAASALPAVVVALVLLVTGDHTPKVFWTLTLLVLGSWIVLTIVLLERVARPLQVLANMLAALREGDFSLRGRGAGPEDPLGLAMLEVNLLGDTLRTQRLGALEATALLRATMGEIDVAVFTVDADGRIRLVNPAGEALLGRPAERLLGRPAARLGLADALGGDAPRVVEAAFPGGWGRWEVRRRDFRQNGRVHTLLVLADVTRALREEELLAWQRLVRVLSHEINNSLTPIKSIAGSLHSLVRRDPRPADADEDLERGLEIIGGRAEALVRFMSSYAQLARLPAPEREPVDVGTWVRRVAALEQRMGVRVDEGPPMVVDADSAQLDQLLINLVRNAADAALETGGGVCVTWEAEGTALVVRVEDEGPGLGSTGNLFVPFFTTKPQGSGIGLVLSRQIAEAHGGSLVIENREEERGAVARLRLPLPLPPMKTGEFLVG